MIDKYNRTIIKTSTNNSVVYTSGDIIVTYPQDNDDGALNTFNAMSTNPQTITDIRASMVLSRLQAKLNLTKAGLLPQIETAISAMAVDNVTRIYYEESPIFERLNPLLINFCTNTLGMTDVQIDSLFNN